MMKSGVVVPGNVGGAKKPRFKLRLDGSLVMVRCGVSALHATFAPEDLDQSSAPLPIDKCLEEVRQAFDAAGLSLREWTTAHGLNYEIAKAVLQGKLAGRRGEAHKVAVALGLKTGKVVEAASFMPPPVKRCKTVRGTRA